jgi:D-alanine-D-alanine ligase
VADSGEIYVIEVNANCYLERSSEFALAAKAHGLEYVELINRIAELASERWIRRAIPKKRKRKRLPAIEAKKSATSTAT